LNFNKRGACHCSKLVITLFFFLGDVAGSFWQAKLRNFEVDIHICGLHIEVEFHPMIPNPIASVRVFNSSDSLSQQFIRLLTYLV
jgi:hypothetical protein